MRRMAASVLTLLVLLQPGAIGTINFAQGRHGINLTNVLENVVVKDVSRQLSDQDREHFVRVVTRYYVDSIRLKQEPYVSPKLALIQLLEFNYPRLRAFEEERGISIRNIARVLNSDAANRSIIDEILTAQKPRKCS